MKTTSQEINWRQAGNSELPHRRGNCAAPHSVTAKVRNSRIVSLVLLFFLFAQLPVALLFAGAPTIATPHIDPPSGEPECGPSVIKLSVSATGECAPRVEASWSMTAPHGWLLDVPDPQPSPVVSVATVYKDADADCGTVLVTADVTVYSNDVEVAHYPLKFPLQGPCPGENCGGQDPGDPDTSNGPGPMMGFRADDSSSAGGPSSGNPPGGPTSGGCDSSGEKSMGSGSADNEEGPDLSFGLGAFSPSESAGLIKLKAKTPVEDLAEPSLLTVPFIRSQSNATVEVFTDDGTLKQVKMPQGLVHITNVTTTPYKSYQMQFFDNELVTTNSTSGGYNAPDATNAIVIWTVENPGGDPNILKVTEDRSGTTRYFTYTYTNDSGTAKWLMDDSGGIRTVASWEAQDPVDTSLTNFVKEIRQGNTIVHRIEKTYAFIHGARVVTRLIEGTGTVTNITAYSYCTPQERETSPPQIEKAEYPNGNWEYFSYDTEGRVTTKYSAYGNSQYPDFSHSRKTEYFYGEVFVSNDNTNLQPWVARKEVVSLPDSTGAPEEVSRIYRSVPEEGQQEEYRCANPGAAWDDPSTLRTVTVRHTDLNDPNTRGKIKWQSHPDGTATFYQYYGDATGALTNITVQTGEPDDFDNPSYVMNGVQTETTFDAFGRTISVTNRYVADGAATMVLSRQLKVYSGPSTPDYMSIDLANRTNEYQYSCCGLSTVINPDQVVTSYEYDTLRRRVSATVLRGEPTGIKWTNVLDAAGRILQSKRIGTNGSVSLLSQYKYDVLGNVTRQTNALWGVTTRTNVLVGGRLSITNVYPDGGTRIATYYRDGRLESISGTAVSPARYKYGVEQDVDYVWREYTLTVKQTETGGTNEWTKEYVDGLGRPCQTTYAAESGPTPYSRSFYNSRGQLAKQVDPDGITTLYEYNDKGERVYTVVDMDKDDIIDFDGTDRVTALVSDVLAHSSTNVNRTRTFAWNTPGFNTSNIVSMAEISTDGLVSWETRYRDANTPVTTETETSYLGNGVRSVRTTNADGSYTVALYSYGRLVSVTRYDSGNEIISATSYGYDPYGRQDAVTDGRNGTTTSTFNDADQVLTVTTPAPGAGQAPQITTTSYDQSLRVWRIVQPDGTSVTNDYYPTGLLKKTSGSRTYPVAYSYDYAGRMTTMTNWSGFPASGARVTTWNYNEYRGWLDNKRYPNENTGEPGSVGPEYTYTDAGRLESRTWANETATAYSYNDAGDLEGVDYADETPDLVYTYDRRGRRSTVTQGGTNETAFLYNNANGLIIETNTAGLLVGLSVTNGYDQYLRKAEVAAVDSSSRFLDHTFGYDDASRLSTVTDSSGGPAYSATYEYLAKSSLLSNITFKTGAAMMMTTTKQYDYLNRLLGVSSLPYAGSTVSFSYTYNSANQRIRSTLADGSYWLYEYDSLGQVKSGKRYWADQTPVAGQQFEYTHDDIGNRRETKAGGDENGAGLRTATYGANFLNQYTNRTVPGAVDVMGIALSTNTVTVNTLATYRKGEYFRKELAGLDNDNDPVWEAVTVRAEDETDVTGHVFVPETPETFAYDDDGNLVNDGRWTYSWDAENRLVAMTPNTDFGPRNSLLFDYDWQGRRIRKRVWDNTAWSGTPTNDVVFLYDGWNLLAELNATNYAVIRSCMWGSDLSGTMQGAGGVSGLLKVSYTGAATTNCFVAFDGNGNLAALVNAGDGTLSARYEYGPFGEVIRATGPMARANPFRFSSKYQDDETDLLYYGYRYYNASTGRWLSRDPWEEKGGLNLYANVANNLLSNSDPDGRGMKDCLKALAELAKATAKMAGRVDDMVRWVEAGNQVDPGHQKSLRQARNGVNNALARVKKQCGCVLDAAALATVLTAAEEALAAAAEWLPWVIAF